MTIGKIGLIGNIYRQQVSRSKRKKRDRDVRNGILNCGKKHKKVYQYTKDFVFLKDYISINEAGRKTNISVSNIHAVCKGKRKSAGGYIFSFKKVKKWK